MRPWNGNGRQLEWWTYTSSEMRIMGNAESATIEDGLGAFHLEREPEGIHLLSVVAGPGGAVLLRGDGRVPLWRSRGTIDGGPFEFSGADGPSSLRPLRKSGVRISWRREDPTGLRTDATVTMKLVGSGFVNLELKLDFGDPVRLREVEFPILGSLSGEAGTFYAPYGYGKALALGPDASYQGRYPSHHCTMQFLAWRSGASSLYLGCHDPLHQVLVAGLSIHVDNVFGDVLVFGVGLGYAHLVRR